MKLFATMWFCGGLVIGLGLGHFIVPTQKPSMVSTLNELPFPQTAPEVDVIHQRQIEAMQGRLNAHVDRVCHSQLKQLSTDVAAMLSGNEVYVSLGALTKAFSLVESSDRPLAPYKDGSESAFGYFGFHMPRWLECGGKREDWGKSNWQRETAVLLAEYQRAGDAYRKKFGASFSSLSAKNQLIWFGNYHNRGRGSLKETPYTQKLLAAFSKAAKAGV